ncbi:hypothetical protein A8L34_25810 [Bacillus sp. FJAT-27264]|nr:hypothetical protein A8L34_25810 [Bacillus sp. FJAT-27264]
MPLFLYEREAFSDFIAILKEHVSSKAVVHCFTGNQPELKVYLEMGFYFGITRWICDERRGKHLRGLVRIILPNWLMIETDAPFLPLRDLNEKPTDGWNEPAFLQHPANRSKLYRKTCGRDR